MFSKFQSIVFLLSLSVAFMGCDKFLRSSQTEPKEETVVIETSKELSCMSEVPNKLKRFFDDQASPSDMPAAISCLQSALTTFMKYTKGEDASSYSGQEMQHFFNRYLLKENKIADSFRIEIMKIKVLFVGGSADQFTRAELEAFSKFLGDFGMKLQNARGNMRLVFMRQDQTKVTDADVLKAQTLLKEIVTFFLENTKIISAKYEFNDLVKLGKEVGQFLDKPETADEVLKWEPLIKAVKVLFLGENSKLSNLSEWRTAFHWAVDTYFAIVRWNYLVKPLEYELPEDWNVLMAWTDQLFYLVEKSPQMLQNKILEAGRIDELIDRVYEQKLFKSEKISKDLAKQTYRKAIAYLLEDSRVRGTAPSVAGISLKHLKTLKLEYRVWRLSQQFWVDTFIKAKRVKNGINTRNIRWEYNRYDFMKIINSMQPGPGEDLKLIQSWKDLGAFILPKYIIVTNNQGKLVMDHDLDTKINTLTGGNRINSNRSYLRLIIRGYGENKKDSLFDNQVPKQNFIDLEEDFREFAQKFGLVDPRTASPAGRIFSEANFLTYDGDGNDLLSAVEGVQLLAEMFSGGGPLVDELTADYDMMTANLKKMNAPEKCYTGNLDYFGKKTVNEFCFRSLIKKRSAKYFEAMPGTAKYIMSMTDDQFDDFYNSIMQVAYFEKHLPNVIEQSEARSFMVIMHYIESLMVVYDANRDGLLSEAEALTAFPRFSKFLAKMSPLGDWFLGDIFLFMIHKGVKPTAGALIKFKIERTMGLAATPRLNIIKVLGLLKAEAKAEALKAAQATR